VNIIETGTLLAKIQAFDNRNVDDQTTIAWHQILEPYALADCVTAVIGYYRKSTAWMMPAHVTERVRVIEQDRVNSFRRGLRLSDADETEGNTALKNRHLYRLAATGQITPAEHVRYLDGNLTLAEMRPLRAIQ
jgi:hypothetical protein